MKIRIYHLLALLLLVPALAIAVPVKFTYTSPVSSGGVAGVSDGDILTLEIIADNGGSGLLSQSWIQADISSAFAFVETYNAVFNFPYLNNPVFVTDAAGLLTSTAWVDVDENNTDNLGSGSPKFFANGLRTSQGNFMEYQGPWPFFATWSINNVSRVPEPASLTLLVLGLAGLGVTRIRKKT